MYGFIGQLTGQSLSRLLTISDIGDRNTKLYRGDEPEDKAATTFGYELAEEYNDNNVIDWNRLTLTTFESKFNAFRNLNILTTPTKNLKQHDPPFELNEPIRQR